MESDLRKHEEAYKPGKTERAYISRLFANLLDRQSIVMVA